MLLFAIGSYKQTNKYREIFFMGSPSTKRGLSPGVSPYMDQAGMCGPKGMVFELFWSV